MSHSTLHTPHYLLIRRDRRAIALWLVLCAVLVALIVPIGGYTRLSGSGLSITEWKPIHGMIPPLGRAQWEEEFRGYQASPQYLKVNKGMTLEEFKVIFWPEFIHRLWGRTVGAVLLLPLLVFALRGSIAARLGWRLAGIFALGGLQGLIGWLMVHSGLIDNPQVSPIRLALHLSMALLILALLIWTALDVVNSGQRPAASKEISSMAAGGWSMTAWFSLLCLQIVLGAFMAGLHAGLMYNTWPDMNGHFLPESWGNIEIVQFLHRNIAVLVAFGFVFWWYYNQEYVKNAALVRVCTAIALLIGLQFILGVLTLIKAVPLPLAMLHQSMAVALFATAVTLLYKVRKYNSGE